MCICVIGVGPLLLMLFFSSGRNPALRADASGFYTRPAKAEADLNPIRTIKSYILWTHPRGGFHYDVMVTVILAFIFLTPRTVFKDSPNYRPPHPNEIVVKPDGPGAFVYELSASALPPEESNTEAALKRALEPVAGSVEISRYDELRNASGKVVGYRVWAHR